ncbi:MAG: radical SAM protein [Planctomycetota bacterium]|nr:radical SAM protein [Planctomycetota bacterium]
MKIGFVAMSGVRSCDEKLLSMGLTLPGFVERSKTIASLPSLGLLTLAGMTPKQHEVVYWEVDDLADGEAIADDLDLVVISSFTARIQDGYSVADQFLAQGTPVALGGLHVTVLPEEASQHADTIVIGEGEAVWLELLEDLAADRLRPRYSSFDRPLFSLDDAPMPAYELLDISKYNRLTVQTTRGCPLKCEFCAASIMLTPHYKQKPIAKVLAEIDKISSIWPRPFIEFADDNSFINTRFWKKLLPQLQERRVKWFTETDISIYEDDELLHLMRKSGCAQILIGLESPSEVGLDGIELKHNRKRDWAPHYISAIQKIQSHGIRVNGCFVLGLDGHTTDVFDQVMEFAEAAELFDVQITYQTPFPGTPLYDRLEREGRLLFPGEWSRCTLFDVNFEPTHMTADELREGFYGLSKRLYSEQQTAWRRETFKEKYMRAKRQRSE